ncbi:MAG TPA: helix-turn-helix transcriptional regulator [Blastocatellia bacterium]|nr:helix-turn-helix transcriptional regulator [Blastocatellia bacterium]
MQEQVLMPAWRESTNVWHYRAVERVITLMYDRYEEDLGLSQMADTAIISPYHFNRVFRRITGIPPVQFLGAIRLEMAKRLLLTTRQSVIDVCFQVGYNSLGTFTRRFTQLVGLSPCRLRRLEREINLPELKSHVSFASERLDKASAVSGVTGLVNAPANFSGPIFIGLFSTPIPQGHPVGCTVAMGSGPFHISPVADGYYYPFAVAYPWTERPVDYLLSQEALRGIANPRALFVRNGQAAGGVNLILRKAKLIDPPILAALPFLLAEKKLALALEDLNQKEALGVEPV